MKRILPVLWILILLTSCAGPAAQAPAAQTPPAEPEPPAVQETVQPAEPEQETEEVILFTIHPETLRDTVSDGDTELVFCDLQFPVLAAFRADGTPVVEARTERERMALSVTRVFNEEFSGVREEILAEHGELVSEARERYREAPDILYGPWSQTFTFTAYRMGSIISIAGLYDYYGGGPHPTATNSGWNFDTETGGFLTVPALAKDSLTFRTAVADGIVAQCRERAREYGMTAAELFWEDYEQIAADWDNYAVSFDEEGMTVIFSVYEMGPYAAGPQFFNFSYDWLRPYLGDVVPSSKS